MPENKNESILIMLYISNYTLWLKNEHNEKSVSLKFLLAACMQT